MIPIRDNIPSRGIPFVNYAIIALCALAFLSQLSTGPRDIDLAESLGMVPLRISQPNAEITVPVSVEVQTPMGVRYATIDRPIAAARVAPVLTFVTCMFLHGGWMHFLGNMWFLYIFGDNVEDRLGHFGYLLLYLGTGILAGLSHYITEPLSPIPTIGASGAIAGVMGAYAWFYPHAKVQAVLPIIIFLQVFVLPAPVFLGIWFLFQTFSGVQSLGGEIVGGVAWWAHIGGFIAGGLVAMFIGRTPIDHGEVTTRRF